MSARAYFPNRTLRDYNRWSRYSSSSRTSSDIHADNQWSDWKYGLIKGPSVNRETNVAGTNYAYRPVRAAYAPVLLGVNAIYSLVYTATIS